jgi:DNA-binding XRE family transcriptional regulator
MRGMRKSKKRLAKAGWKIGTAAEFLHLTPEEELYVELKASLSQQLRRRREKSHLTQRELARMLKSSQSRIAKMEKGDPSVSIDLLIKSLLALGTTRREIAKAIA